MSETILGMIGVVAGMVCFGVGYIIGRCHEAKFEMFNGAGPVKKDDG